MKKKYEFIDKQSLKLVIVGDTGVGKSSLASRLSSRPFHIEYKPTVFDNFAATISVDGKPYHLSMFDTAGKEDFNKLRVLSYINSDVFLVCFSVANPESFTNVQDSWVPELRHHIPDTPFILVGTQVDIRQDKMDRQVVRTSFISTKQGIDLASRIGAASYVECSSVSDCGIDDLKGDIIMASQMGMETKCSKQTKCCSCKII